MKTDIPAPADHAIQIRGLCKHYPGFDLGPIDLDVPRGSIFGFVGPNGAGKSTTIDLMFGMGRADAGSVRMLGLDAVADEVAVKTRAAYVGPELKYGNWGKIHKAIRFVRGFYPATTWQTKAGCLRDSGSSSRPSGGAAIGCSEPRTHGGRMP